MGTKLGGVMITWDRFTRKRIWSAWLFGDWRVGVVVHGLEATLAVLTIIPAIEARLGWIRGGAGTYALHLGWFHLDTSRRIKYDEDGIRIADDDLDIDDDFRVLA